MIQSYQTDPVLYNYLAPSYPIFIQIKFLISSLNAKKTIKNAKSDIAQVHNLLSSSLLSLALRENALSSHQFSSIFKFESSKKNLRPAQEWFFSQKCSKITLKGKLFFPISRR